MAGGMLMLHAFPLDHQMWRPQMEALGSATAVIPAHLPGFGGTAFVGESTSMAEAADLAEKALGGTGADRVVVVGLSMGGYVALEFWERHRDRVAGLVLANTRAGADDEAGKQRRRDLAQRLRSEGIDFLADSPPPLLSDNAPADLRERVQAWIRYQSPEAVAAAALGMAERRDWTDRLGEIDVPTLVITGSDDTLIPPDASKELADRIPNARFEVIQGAGHLSNLEQPDEFNRLLREHLEPMGMIGEPGPATAPGYGSP